MARKADKKLSNITSQKIFIILSILSFGIYELVWMYRNWKFFKEKEKIDISPFWRAWFAIFFIHSLFKKILEYAKKEGYKNHYSSAWRTFFWIILLLISFIEHPIFFFLSMLTFLTILAPLDAINFYYKKKERNCVKRTLEWWHMLLIIVCVLFWILAILSMFALEV